MSKTIGGCPAIVRADIGTENGYVQVLLRIMRGVHDDAFAGKGSFVFGKSIANQMIESWWNTLRKEYPLTVLDKCTYTVKGCWNI